MAAHIITDHGEPDLMDHTTGLAHPLGLDAVDTLKAVQGIINTYLANAATDGRSAIPTPEPSPVQVLMDHGKRELVGMNGCQAELIRGRAGRAQQVHIPGIATDNIDEVNASQLVELVDINDGFAPDGRHTSRIIQVTAKRGGPVEHGSQELNINLTSGTMTSNGPGTHQTTGNRIADGNIPDANSLETPLPPPTTPVAEQEHLLDLASKVTHAVSRIATDDAARIKAATAALELAAAARPPTDTIMGWFVNMSIVSAVRLFLHWGAFDMIPPGTRETITYAELAQRVGADEGLVGQCPLPPPSHTISP
jgi:hypothetical protein